MSVISVRIPGDVHAALKEYCDRIGSNANAEIIIAVRKHIGLPTFEERIEWIEAQVAEISDRLEILEQTSAIAKSEAAESN